MQWLYFFFLIFRNFQNALYNSYANLHSHLSSYQHLLSFRVFGQYLFTVLRSHFMVVLSSISLMFTAGHLCLLLRNIWVCYPFWNCLGAHIDDLPVIPALRRYRPEVPGAVWLAGLARSRRYPLSNSHLSMFSCHIPANTKIPQIHTHMKKECVREWWGSWLSDAWRKQRRRLCITLHFPEEMILSGLKAITLAQKGI